MLLEALRALGYMRARDVVTNLPGFGNLAGLSLTAKWLVRASPDNVAAGFDFWHMALNEHWHNLEDSIRTGRPPLDFYAWVEQHPQASRRRPGVQAWMVALARIAGPDDPA